MTTQERLFADIPTEAEQYEQDRDDELDRTPRLVVRETLPLVLARFAAVVDQAVADHGVLAAVDLCAGAGPWSSELREWAHRAGVPVHIHGIEKRASERVHLRRWCDTVEIALVDDALERARAAGRRWDIAIGNPHFSGLATMLPLARSVARLTMLLHTEQAFTKGKAMRAVLREHPPSQELRIGGDIHFRGGSSGADMRPYSVSAWLDDGPAPGSAWECRVVELSDAARRWREPPGAETLIPGLRTAPGWSPQLELAGVEVSL